MTQAGAYGEKLGQFLRLKEAPPSLVTRSLRSAELAVTETRNDRPLTGLSGSLTTEDAFLVSLKLRDYPDCELWQRGKFLMKADVRAGATYLYDLKLDPRYVIDKPFHSLFFYLPRSALDGVAEQCGAKRIDQLDCRIGVGHDDEVIRHIGAALQHGLRRPHEANQLFIDHMMLGLTTHVAQTYGGLQRRTEPARGGLASWQARRACEVLGADLGGKLSLQKIAAELDLSVSHFSRAFRISVGLPPHQWLLHQRVKAAQQLMSVRSLPLSEIAISAGFANQSHFTRVFSSIVGVSPAVWRRQMPGTSGTNG
ncbi:MULTISPECIES: helix-turn-helix domain-containing protein [Bradyrhizobium]|uniref:helix-turn-helix domain-containing protein n=1 Tax=Bradyrhizobium TaxID=374 RepID=UPI00293E87EB|nr:AraC family transcriptional regulator [Bradyrhizobium sp. NDS-1]WOH72085.1 AraC family transcriptional regulator [Bradyrhizobium sp. NDS-1]